MAPQSSAALAGEVALAEARLRLASASGPLASEAAEKGAEAQDGRGAEYALECVLALRRLATSDRMDEGQAALLARVAGILDSALRSEVRPSVDVSEASELPQRFHVRECQLLCDRIEELKQETSELQAKVTVTRNKYVAKVKDYSALEDRLEAALEMYQNGAIAQKGMQDSIQHLQDQLELENVKHNNLTECFEKLSKDLNKKSQQVYEACTRRKLLRMDVKRAAEKLERMGCEPDEAADGRVNRAAFLELQAKTEAVREEIVAREKALQIKQTEYAEILSEIKVAEEKGRVVREANEKQLEAEAEIIRTLTPRPDWAQGAATCPWLLWEDEGQEPDADRGDDTTASNGMETVPSADKEKGKRAMRRRSSFAAPRRQRRNSIGPEPPKDLAASKTNDGAPASPKPPRLRRNGTVMLTNTTGPANAAAAAQTGRAKRRRSTRDAAKALAEHIDRLNLDGKVLDQAFEDLRVAEMQLREAKDDLNFATTFVPGSGELLVQPQQQQQDTGEAGSEGTGSGMKRQRKHRDSGVNVAKAVLRFSMHGALGGGAKSGAQSTSATDALAGLAAEEGEDVASGAMQLPANQKMGVIRIAEGPSLACRWAPVEFNCETNKKGELFAQAQGKSQRVAPYLRSEGLLQLRLVPRSELLELVSEVWTYKFSKDKMALDSGKSALSCVEAFTQVLKNRYGLQSVLSKWGYNVIFSLEQLRWDADLETFLLSLTGAVPENTYLDQQTMVATLKSFLRRVSAMETGSSLGEVSKEALFASLPQIFPRKTEADLVELELAVHEAQPMSVVFVELLLDPDETASAGFVNLVKRQHLHEIRDHFKELQERLLVAASMYKSVDSCKLEDLVGVLRKMDDALEPQMLHEYLVAGFPAHLTSVKEAEAAVKSGALPPAAGSPSGKSGQAKPPGHKAAAEESGKFVMIAGFMQSLASSGFKPAFNFDIDPQPVVSREHQEQVSRSRSLFSP